MQIRVGFEMVYQCPRPTPMILALNIHHSRASDLVSADHLVTKPAVPVHGYLQRLSGGYGTQPPYGPMDFAGWFEACLGDRWYTFEARNNTPRIGRVLMARVRDACDVALSGTFGPNTLEYFRVWTDVVEFDNA